MAQEISRTLLDLRDQLPHPIDCVGRGISSIQDQSDGLAIAHREASGAVDRRDEFLCAYRYCGVLHLNVCRYQWLGEVPEEWCDEEGQLLLKYRTSEGGLQLPEVWDGEPVLALVYGGLLGPLEGSFAWEGVEISDCSEGAVREALSTLRWDSSTVSAGLDALRQFAQATDPNAAVPVSLFSIIVKKSAVARSYPGGPIAFDKTLGPAKGSDTLYLLSCMSLGDVDSVLNRLFAQGLIPGLDLAVAEMSLGPLLECPGVTFVSEGDFPACWAVKADAALEDASGSWDGKKRTAYTPGNPLGYGWTAPEPPPLIPTRPIITLNGRRLTAHQYYQWRGLHGTGEEDEH